MNLTEALQQIDHLTLKHDQLREDLDELKRELNILRTVLTPPKKKKVVKKDYTKQINASILKTPGIYKKQLFIINK